MAARGDVPSDAVKRVFKSLIEAYAEKITPEHGFKIKSDTLWGRMRGLKKSFIVMVRVQKMVGKL